MKRVLRDYPSFRAFLTDSTFSHIRLGTPATNVLSQLSEPHLPYWEATYQNESTPILATFEAYGRHWQAWDCGNLEFVAVDDHIFNFNINSYQRLQIPRAFNVKWHRLFFLGTHCITQRMGNLASIFDAGHCARRGNGCSSPIH